jgi:hypothetical protein
MSDMNAFVPLGPIRDRLSRVIESMKQPDLDRLALAMDDLGPESFGLLFRGCLRIENDRRTQGDAQPVALRTPTSPEGAGLDNGPGR